MSAETWRIKLDLVRRDLEKIPPAESYLVHYGDRVWDAAADRQSIRAPRGVAVGRQSAVTDQSGCGRLFYFTRSSQADADNMMWRTFRAAARLIDKKSISRVSPSVANEPWQGYNDGKSWISLLHDWANTDPDSVAWSAETCLLLLKKPEQDAIPAFQPPPNPGTLAKNTSSLRFRRDLDELKRLVEFFHGEPEFPVEWAEELPDHYESCIEDVRLASLMLCDALEECTKPELMTDTEESILIALSESDVQLNADKLANASIGKKSADGHFKNVCSGLVKRGYIQNDGHGRGASGYYLTSKGERWIEVNGK